MGKLIPVLFSSLIQSFESYPLSFLSLKNFSLEKFSNARSIAKIMKFGTSFYWVIDLNLDDLFIWKAMKTYIKLLNSPRWDTAALLSRQPPAILGVVTKSTWVPVKGIVTQADKPRWVHWWERQFHKTNNNDIPGCYTVCIYVYYIFIIEINNQSFP